MEIKLFTVPNILTLGNLMCGVVAVQAIVEGKDLRMAFYMVILAAIFDFLDGFAARLLKQSSKIGGELDSLADMVSFGLVPTFVMVNLMDGSQMLYGWGRYIPFVIVACSALRLAKFNVDESQSDIFIGLPTPACALFCASIGLMQHGGAVDVAPWMVAVLSLVMAWLLISPIKMFALKFKGFGLRGNEVRYGFVVFSLALMYGVNLGVAVASIILCYALLSAIMHFACRGKKCSK